MSFSNLKVAELKKIAETFAVDLGEAKSKQDIIVELEEQGVSYQMVTSFENAEKQTIEISDIEKKQRQAKSNKQENSILVKMERMNHSYQANGYTFTQEHPFVAMPESDAQRIFDTQAGFRLATPREAQEFYN